MVPKSMTDWKTSEEYETIRELQTTNVALQDTLKETEKARDKVTQSLDCSEYQMKRFAQQILEFQDIVSILQEIENSKIGTCHVRCRDKFSVDSSIATSVHVEKELVL